MMLKAFYCAAVLAMAPVLEAQTAPAINPVYKRAQTMVNDGNVTAGRALVDSMISTSAPGSNDYAEAVYWRAVLGATAAEAEMDYRRIVVDYPLSPRVEDALIRLAQLEIARANYDAALRHLNRLAVEHPQSPARARAGYWTARAMFDKNDVQGGCAATADALARTNENDAELRNQITYLNQRCAGIALTTPSTGVAVRVTGPQSGATIAPTANPQTGAITTPIANPPAAVTVARDSVGSAAVIRTSPPAVIGDSSRISVATVPAREPVKEAAPVKSSPKPPARPRDAGPTMVEIPRDLPRTVPATPEGTKVYSVQVAAYNVKSQAESMVARLKKGGYEARVDGTAMPYRVRIGKYATQAQASAVQRSLKAKQIPGFVVQADIQ